MYWDELIYIILYERCYQVSDCLYQPFQVAPLPGGNEGYKGGGFFSYPLLLTVLLTLGCRLLYSQEMGMVIVPF